MSGNITSNEYHLFYHLNTEIFAMYVGALAVVLLLVTVLVKLMLRPRVVVNCWFCNKNTRVASDEINSWYCLHCEQYNGFSPDGDYNKDIPEQRLGSVQDGFTYTHKSKLSSYSNGLCSKCNENQEMKIKHLATFQAVIPSSYEEELHIYRNQLENAYRLCQKCETVLSETLGRKKGLVLGMQLQQSEKRILGKNKYFKFSLHGVCKVGLTGLAAALCFMIATATPILENVNFPLLNAIQEQVKSNYWAVLAANFLAQLVLTLSTARKVSLVVCGAHLCLYLLEDQWGLVEDYSYALSFLSGLTLVLTMCSSKPRKSAFVKLKKVDKPLRNSRPLEREKPSCIPEETAPVVKPVVKQPVVKPPLVKPVVEESKMELSSPQDDNSSVDSAFSNHDDDSVRGDVNSLIQSLSEWNSGAVESPRPPSSRHEFQSRQYKPVLNPPRLFSTSPKSTKSFNESSWVAGGFWQNHQNESAQSISRPGSPNSVYSQTTSPSIFEPLRPSTPTHYPMYVPYGPHNGFQQPFGFQPYMYPASSVVNPMWNQAVFQPICSSPMTPSALTPSSAPSSASCSSASTCGSVLRRGRPCDVTSFESSNEQPRSSFFKALWQNSSVILYTSAFYIAVTAIAVFAYRKW